MSENIEIAILYRLYKTAFCVESNRTDVLRERFHTAGWIAKGKNRLRWDLIPSAVEEVQARLDVLRPSWREDANYLIRINKNPFNPADWAALPALQRAVSRKKYINRHNWRAISGAGPKHQPRRVSLDILTKDWLLRVRPNEGLLAVMSGMEFDVYKIATQWGEWVIPERAWLEVSGFKGKLPNAVLTCENLGAYIDIPPLKDISIIYSPGNDFAPAVEFLKMLPLSVPWVHFGDLDPRGIEIASLIAQASLRPHRVYIPSFIQEYWDLAHKVRSKWGDIPCNGNPILNKLKANGRGMHQERVLLDARIGGDIADFLSQVVEAGES